MAAATAPDWSGIEPDGGRAGCCVPVAVGEGGTAARALVRQSALPQCVTDSDHIATPGLAKMWIFTMAAAEVKSLRVFAGLKTYRGTSAA